MRSRAPLRALVLSAGRGERLRPLTDLLPKPLMPVLGKPLLEHTLSRLAAAGVHSAAVNLHHLGHEIRAALGDRVGEMRLTFSWEESLLGTLGPFGRLQEFFKGIDPVLLVNGDSLCRWPVAAAMRAHHAAGADATLLLSSSADVNEFGGGVVVDRAGRILSFRGESGSAKDTRRGVFAGLHVISARLLAGTEARPAEIVRDLYEPLLEQGGLIRGVFTRRRWHDLGTPERYLGGVLAEARACRSSGSLESGLGWAWCGEGARVEPGAEVRASVLEADVVIGAGSTIVGSLILSGAGVGPGAEVVDSILAPGVQLAGGSSVSDRLVTRYRIGGELRPGDCVLGDLVHSPIG